MSVVAFIFATWALLTALSTEAKVNEQNNRLTAWNTYQGHYGDYHVRIEEEERG